MSWTNFRTSSRAYSSKVISLWLVHSSLPLLNLLASIKSHFHSVLLKHERFKTEFIFNICYIHQIISLCLVQKHSSLFKPLTHDKSYSPVNNYHLSSFRDMMQFNLQSYMFLLAIRYLLFFILCTLFILIVVLVENYLLLLNVWNFECSKTDICRSYWISAQLWDENGFLCSFSNNRCFYNVFDCQNQNKSFYGEVCEEIYY